MESVRVDPDPSAAEAALICVSDVEPGAQVLLPAGRQWAMFFNDTPDRLVSIAIDGQESSPADVLAPGAARVIGVPLEGAIRYQIQGLSESPRSGLIRRGEVEK